MTEKKPFSIRYNEESDAVSLKEWLMDPEAMHWFPMANEIEVDDAVKIWISYGKNKSGITAVIDGKPCGMAVIYPAIYRKLAHQSLVSIIVAKEHRQKGIGRALMERIIEMAKNDYQMEMLHLEVYERNPAKHLYEKLGFVEYGCDPEFVKEDGKFVGKICMEKWL